MTELSHQERIARSNEQALRLRRRAGMFLGGILAYLFGGLPGLIAAVTFVVAVRAYNAGRNRR